MHQCGHPLDVFGRDDGRILAAFRPCCKRRADTKEGALDLFGPRRDFLVVADAAGEAQDAVQFIDRAIGLDLEVCFGDAGSSGQTGLAATVLLPRDEVIVRTLILPGASVKKSSWTCAGEISARRRFLGITRLSTRP